MFFLVGWLVGWLEVMKFVTEKRNVFFWGGKVGKVGKGCYDIFSNTDVMSFIYRDVYPP